MTARRGYGEGSLFQSANGRWVGFVDLGRAADGKRRRVKVTGRTRAEARSKVAEARQRAEDGLPSGDNRTTLGAFLEEWLTRLPGSVKSANTVDNYTWAVEKHLVPALGGRRLRDLTPDDVVATRAQKRIKAGTSYTVVTGLDLRICEWS